MAVAALAAAADVEPLLHERLHRVAAPGGLPGAGPLQVDGVRRRELLRPLHERGRLVLVVGALGLGEQLAHPVDQPVPVVWSDAHSAPTSTPCCP